MGTITFDGAPCAGAVVLAISAKPRAILGAAVTSADGRFALSIPAGGVALVKLQGVDLAAVAVRSTSDGDIALSTSDSDRYRVTISVNSDATTCDTPIRLFVNPVHIAGIDADLEPFLLRRSQRIVDDAFATFTWSGEPLTLTMQRGEYRIGGTSLSKGGPVAGGPATGLAVTGVAVRGSTQQADGDPAQGFQLAVNGDLELALTLGSVTPS